MNYYVIVIVSRYYDELKSLTHHAIVPADICDCVTHVKRFDCITPLNLELVNGAVRLRPIKPV